MCPTNALICGDNLQVLRSQIPSESIDLAYLDPPFNTNRTYSTFGDKWRWTSETQALYDELTADKSNRVTQMLVGLSSFVDDSQAMAYLVPMTARLVELHRVLKDTGSLYLHCDPTASHYLKIALDSIFGPKNFRNEIVWRRTNAHNRLIKQYGAIHDAIFFYTKSDTFTFHPGKRPYSKEYIDHNFTYQDNRGRYMSQTLTAPGLRDSEGGQPWRDYNPTAKGRNWSIPGKLLTRLSIDASSLSIHQCLDVLDQNGLIIHPTRKDSLPRYKQYLDTSDGIAYQDIWSFQPGTYGVLYESDEGIDEDVKWIDNGDERLGYPTQKPIGLLERIINTSSDEGDLVLDSYAGCGTTIIAANKLKRRWIGIDVSEDAINQIQTRLHDAYLQPVLV